MTVLNNMSPDMRGYINEMQSQIIFLSDRAGGLASALAKAEQELELKNGRIAALEATEKRLEANQKRLEEELETRKIYDEIEE